jgi:branched-chain amino acid transport system substrate-binding protein
MPPRPSSRRSRPTSRTVADDPQLENTFGSGPTKTAAQDLHHGADYGPGIDAETWFTKGFKDAGGEIVGSVRMPLPAPTSRRSCSVQRISILRPSSFSSRRHAAAGDDQAMQERGIPRRRFSVRGRSSMDDNALRSMGDSAIGIRTVFHYGWEHKSPMNEDFVKAYRAEFNRTRMCFSIGGWDGMHLIYEALKKTGGKADGDSLIAAAKGMKWESPRGEISIDPETRDIVQTVYIRKVEKVDGKVQNVEIDKIDNVKDPAKK